jgi:hypothetical protein
VQREILQQISRTEDLLQTQPTQLHHKLQSIQIILFLADLRQLQEAPVGLPFTP